MYAMIKNGVLVSLFLVGLSPTSNAALSLYQTRIVFNESTKPLSLNVTNRNQQDPYLAQSWIEDSEGNKITSPLISLPPIQRVDAGAETQVRLQMNATVDTLPHDRESLFYFYFREIPPKSKKANSVMLAVESKLKIFYRPKSIQVGRDDVVLPGLKNITLRRDKHHYELNNTTPYYFTVVEARDSLDSASVDFESIMISPKSKGMLPDNINFTDDDLALVFVTDFGDQRALIFKCDNNQCIASDIKELPVKK